MSVHILKWIGYFLFFKRENDKKSNHSLNKSIDKINSLDTNSYIFFRFSFFFNNLNDQCSISHWFEMTKIVWTSFLSNWSLYILLMIRETIGSRPRQSICKYRLQDPCAKLHSFSHIMDEGTFSLSFYNSV